MILDKSMDNSENLNSPRASPVRGGRADISRVRVDERPSRSGEKPILMVHASNCRFETREDVEKLLDLIEDSREIEELDLSNNKLTCDGMAALCEGLAGKCVSMRVLKVFKNHIGDEGAKSLAELIGECPKAISEIHFSHNNLSYEGIQAIAKAILMNPVYPELKKSRDGTELAVPVWFRTEHNPVQNLENVPDYDLKDEVKNYRPNYFDQKAPFIFVGNARGRLPQDLHTEHGPLIHMPHVDDAKGKGRGGRGKGKGKGKGTDRIPEFAPRAPKGGDRGLNDDDRDRERERAHHRSRSRGRRGEYENRGERRPERPRNDDRDRRDDRRRGSDFDRRGPPRDDRDRRRPVDPMEEQMRQGFGGPPPARDDFDRRGRGRSPPRRHDDRRSAPHVFDDRRGAPPPYDDRRGGPPAYDDRRADPHYDRRRPPQQDEFDIRHDPRADMARQRRSAEPAAPGYNGSRSGPEKPTHPPQTRDLIELLNNHLKWHDETVGSSKNRESTPDDEELKLRLPDELGKKMVEADTNDAVMTERVAKSRENVEEIIMMFAESFAEYHVNVQDKSDNDMFMRKLAREVKSRRIDMGELITQANQRDMPQTHGQL